jgi:uncharacterized RDD family membrane protein YckC
VSGLTSGDPLQGGGEPDRGRGDGRDDAQRAFGREPSAQDAFGREPVAEGSLWAGGAQARSEPAHAARPAPPPPPVLPPPGASAYGDGPVPPGAGGQAPPVFGAPVAGRFELASWGARVVATLVDGAILIVLAAILFVPLTAAGVTVDSDAGAVAFVLTLMGVVLAFTLAALLYAPVLMARWDGQTIGRRLVGIRVVRADGRSVDFGWSVLREVGVKAFLVGFIASATFGLAWLLDVLWPLWDPENRALHDLVVQTRVVKA